MEGHYCNGELTDLSIVGKAHCEGNCSSHQMIHEESHADHYSHKDKKCIEKSDCEKQCESEQKKGCCKTERLSDLSNLEYSVQLNVVHPIVLLSVLLDCNLFVEETEESCTAWEEYDEPIPDKDRPILYQSILI